MVERAQQKLKLDAMVVQQGRLQEKEKKMSKQDLLDTVRFGAEKIFRSKESDISDADIDLILEQGRKRTEEMNEKLQLADKGDIAGWEEVRDNETAKITAAIAPDVQAKRRAEHRKTLPAKLRAAGLLQHVKKSAWEKD